jgi:hypothetical protein
MKSEEILRKQIRQLLREAKFTPIGGVEFRGLSGRVPLGAEGMKVRADTDPGGLLSKLLGSETVGNLDSFEDVYSYYKKIFKGPSAMSDAGFINYDKVNKAGVVIPTEIPARTLAKLMYYCLEAAEKTPSESVIIQASNKDVRIMKKPTPKP